MTEQEKREKALQALEHCDLCSDMPNCPGCAYLREPDCMEHLKRDIIALLKEQEPVKPRIMEFIDEGLTWEKYEVPTCGVCGALLGGALFCPMCGRAVKWE